MKTTREWIELIDFSEDIRLSLITELRIKRCPNTNNDYYPSLYTALLGSFSWSAFERVYHFNLRDFAERVEKDKVKLKSDVTVKEFSHYNI